ncbi:hypothetical protein [Streptomyces sp. NPDC102437]|uniref:hypothetical protein n=1 Tax=Streptomyces sp. NPDC102437 TaxID=3366175 RepID=UPI003820AE92
MVDGEFRVSLGILQVAQVSGGFPDSTMALVDERGWRPDHEVTAPSLLLWSGGIEEIFSNSRKSPVGASNGRSRA